MSRKTRLTVASRQALVALAAQRVQTPAETAAYTRAHTRAADLIRAELAAKFPAADMRVLKKYDMARIDLCVRITGPEGGRVRMFKFLSDAPPPLVPRSGGYSCEVRQVSQAVWNAVQVVDLAAEQKKAAHDKILADYKALINAATTFEDVVAVWPEAEEMRARIYGSATALSVVTPELKARIAADVARRNAA